MEISSLEVFQEGGDQELRNLEEIKVSLQDLEDKGSFEIKDDLGGPQGRYHEMSL